MHPVFCITERVLVVLGMKPDEVFSKGRQASKVKARSLLCFLASRELGVSHTTLAKRLEMSVANVGFSVERGESIVSENSRRYFRITCEIKRCLDQHNKCSRRPRRRESRC